MSTDESGKSDVPEDGSTRPSPEPSEGADETQVLNDGISEPTQVMPPTPQQSPVDDQATQAMPAASAEPTQAISHDTPADATSVLPPDQRPLPPVIPAPEALTPAGGIPMSEEFKRSNRNGAIWAIVAVIALTGLAIGVFWGLLGNGDSPGPQPFPTVASPTSTKPSPSRTPSASPTTTSASPTQSPTSPTASPTQTTPTPTLSPTIQPTSNGPQTPQATPSN